MTIAKAKLIGFNYPGVGPEGYVRIQQSAWADVEQQLADIIEGGLTDNLVYGATTVSIAVDYDVAPGQPMVTAVEATVADLVVRLPANNAAGVTLGKPYQVQNIGAIPFALASSVGEVLVPVLAPGEIASASAVAGASANDPWAVAVWTTKATLVDAEAGTGGGYLDPALTHAAIAANRTRDMLYGGNAYAAQVWHDRGNLSGTVAPLVAGASNKQYGLVTGSVAISAMPSQGSVLFWLLQDPTGGHAIDLTGWAWSGHVTVNTGANQHTLLWLENNPINGNVVLQVTPPGLYS